MKILTDFYDRKSAQPKVYQAIGKKSIVQKVMRPIISYIYAKELRNEIRAQKFRYS